jgi:hypothetical protein
MKKAKMILAAVVVMAGVSGIFAFKANSPKGRFIFTNTTTTLPCTITLQNATLTVAGTKLIPASTTTTGASCPLTFTTTAL